MTELEAAKEVDAMTDRTMREKIAAVIVANRACDNWHEPLPADLELADAILAALPGMVPELVWEVPDERHFARGDCHGYTEQIAYLDKLDWYRIYPVSDNEWMWVRQFRMVYHDGQRREDVPRISPDDAKAAADAHHRAAMCKAMGWKP